VSFSCPDFIFRAVRPSGATALSRRLVQPVFATCIELVLVFLFITAMTGYHFFQLDHVCRGDYQLFEAGRSQIAIVRKDLCPGKNLSDGMLVACIGSMLRAIDAIFGI
jgi:hypothetical protein